MDVKGMEKELSSGIWGSGFEICQAWNLNDVLSCWGQQIGAGKRDVNGNAEAKWKREGRRRSFFLFLLRVPEMRSKNQYVIPLVSSAPASY